MAERKTNGKRNKQAGSQWERDVVNLLKKRNLYPHAVTCRTESKRLDDCGIDIMNKDEFKNGMMFDSIQTKTSSKSIAYPGVLDRIRKENRPGPVIFHRQTAASETGKQMERDLYAITYLDRYLDLIAAEAFVRELKHLMVKWQDASPSPLRDADIAHTLKHYGL